ncbi:hypothetical protein CGCF245_v001511 [Colletotrichum fructicola]|nr:hypothetical protein CGCF245_v001511 [Colletotrichum fructicola]
MLFFHKYGERIAQQLVCEDSEAENRKDDREGMPLEDKMNLWWDEAHCSNGQVDEDRCRDGEDIVLGEDDKSNASGGDNDDEDVGIIKASSLNKTVLESGAFRWLVRSLRNEMALQEDYDSIRGHDSRVDIRKKILRQLPTGKISKSRSPTIHKVMMLSIKQYMKQTWPSTYYQIMSLLQYPRNYHGANTFVVALPDSTHLVASAEQTDLVLGISGPAHTVAECIEQLAWVLAALYFPLGYSDGISQRGPIISEPYKVLYDPTDRVLKLMQPPPRDEHYSCFDINVGASDQPLVSAEQSKLISAFSGRHVMVPGYPILRRSAACIGIEITPEHVLKFWEGLVLVQQKTGVYLWHGNREPHQICNCRPEDGRDQSDLRTFEELKKLLSSRHFMGLCNNSGG